MDIAQVGDIAVVEYSIKYSNGKLYDSTFGKEPLTFEIGKYVFLPGFEDAVLGMCIGGKKLITLKADVMFGNSYDTLVRDIPLSTVPGHINKKVGQKIEVTLNNLPPLKATIVAVKDDHITLDANLDMADESFLVSIELLDLMRPEGN